MFFLKFKTKLTLPIFLTISSLYELVIFNKNKIIQFSDAFKLVKIFEKFSYYTANKNVIFDL